MTQWSENGEPTTPENPGKSALMLWFRDVAIPYEGDECLIWPFGRRRNGYGQFGRDGKMIDVHRYICERFKGPSPSPKHQAAHSCGRGHDGCVNKRHLFWKTPSANQIEAWEHNSRGGRRYKLTDEQVAEIRALIGAERPEVTAKRYDVTEANIRRIQTGKTRLRPHKVLSEADIIDIRSARGTVSLPALAKKYGLNVGIIWRAQVGRTYKHVKFGLPVSLTGDFRHD